MKKFKNITLFILAFITSTQIYSIAPEKNELPSSDTNQAFVLDGVHYTEEFKPYTTDKWIYNQKTTTQKHNEMYTSIFGKHPNGKSITDETSEKLLSSRVTRTYTQVITENGVSVTVKETWISRNPSYITWINGALVVGAVAGIVLGAATISALGNMGAASVNAYGNVGSSVVDAYGNIGAATMNNPESIKTLGNAATQITKEANKNPEIQKMLKNINAQMEQKRQQDAVAAAVAA